jgi:oligosaccharide repeat unit polymerase
MELKIASIKHVALSVLLGAVCLSYLGAASDPGSSAVIIILVIAAYLVFARKLDYTDTYVVFAVPWMMIIGFSVVQISGYSKDIHKLTYEIVFAALFTGLLACGYRKTRTGPALNWLKPHRSMIRAKYSLAALDIGLLGFTALNIAIAGYVPLLRGFLTGDTGYIDFGVHGLYGFYLAFANALAIFYILLFFRTKRKVFLLRYAMVLVIFVLLVTRQNLLSVGVETVAVYSLVRKKISWRSILVVLLIGAVSLSLLGLMRSGDIKEIANIKAQYMWIPDPIIWIYCYSYFNIANVDNLVNFSNAPFFNGSSVANLLPSFLRPDYNMGDFLQSIYFTVSSYIYPIYQDLGILGVIALTFLALKITARWQQRVYVKTSLFSVGTFAVLYFCAAFSFFVNFWFYLPVIFQIVFFKLLSNLQERAFNEYRPRQARLLLTEGTP